MFANAITASANNSADNPGSDGASRVVSGVVSLANSHPATRHHLRPQPSDHVTYTTRVHDPPGSPESRPQNASVSKRACNAVNVSADTDSSAGSGPRSVHSCGIRIRTPEASQKNVNRPALHRPANTRNLCPQTNGKDA